ncbi:hypothetical protein R1flu_009713 [Riccia fluitans]|uniref:Uncharacterized protein n=1 Tax=Riccia fluitans TaxID=41844 RepID=A0ABD1Z2Y0_9MARC
MSDPSSEFLLAIGKGGDEPANQERDEPDYFRSSGEVIQRFLVSIDKTRHYVLKVLLPATAGVLPPVINRWGWNPDEFILLK